MREPRSVSKLTRQARTTAAYAWQEMRRRGECGYSAEGSAARHVDAHVDLD
jgi:hypothetical protein